jgi:predicted RNase H-like HicB family nuclease
MSFDATSEEKTAMRYTIVLTVDPEGGGYTAVVPALPGCVTQGNTIDEAMDHVRDAIAVYFMDESPESLAAAGVVTDVIVREVDVPIPA